MGGAVATAMCPLPSLQPGVPITAMPAVPHRAHTSDVTGISWAPDGQLLASCSVDTSVMIWDPIKGMVLQRLENAGNFVTGVAWDPTGQYLASIANDRAVRLYMRRLSSKLGTSAAGYAVRDAEPSAKAQPRKGRLFTLVHTWKACPLSQLGGSAAKQDDAAKPAKHRLLMDESVPTFFRRLEWTADGSMLLVPTGQAPVPGREPGAVTPTTWAFVREAWDAAPLLHYPGLPSASVAVASSPQIAELRPKVAQVASPVQWPYRQLWAVATLESLLVYDSQQPLPIAALSNAHYDKLTDIAWSRDGQMLAVASMDGYISLLQFDETDMPVSMGTDGKPAHLRYAPPPMRELRAAAAAAGMTEAQPESAGPAAAAPASAAAATPAEAPAAVNVLQVRSKKSGAAKPAAAPASDAGTPEQPAQAGKKRSRITPTLIPA